jgi:BirA family biotin operon repressor/biotin-[acetyl-CoA-carboxylase] ligase
MKNEFTIYTIEKAASSNLLMQEWLNQKKLNPGDVIRVVNQENGIGQSGNSWESEAGKNLTFSMFLDTSFLPAAELFSLNKAISLAIVDYLTNKQIADVQIKWPNDVYVGSKKISGMLTYNSFLGEKLENSIVGIGLNMNQTVFKSDARNPVSLKQLTEYEYDLDAELAALLLCIESQWNLLRNGKTKTMEVNYKKMLYGFGQKRAYKDKNGVFNGKICGVDLYGRLTIQHENESRKIYDIKEIEFL